MPPMEPPTDHQETMFEEQTGFNPSYEEEPPYEPADELPVHASEQLDEPKFDQPRSLGETENHAAGPSQPAASHPVTSQPTQLEAPPTAPPVSLPEAASEAAPEAQPEVESDSRPLTVLTVDDFAALEERVLRAVEVVRRERHARIAAEERAVAIETELTQLKSEAPAVELLRKEVESLRVEREQVRLRVERLLSQLDALEL